MAKYKVWGRAYIGVAQVVEAETPEEAVEKAHDEFPGLTGFCGNGGNDKLIGVYGEDSSVSADDDDIEFTDAEVIDSD